MEQKYISDRSVRTYRDIDLNFTSHPVTRDVVMVRDVNAIKAALRNLVLLNYYEKPFHPEIGTGVYGSLFELWPDDASLSIMISKMESAIRAYEPRAESIGISINREDSDPNSMYVSVYFVPVNSIEPVRFSFFLKPVR